MKLVNLGFATLRERVPHLGRAGKKMSKVSRPHDVKGTGGGGGVRAVGGGGWGLGIGEDYGGAREIYVRKKRSKGKRKQRGKKKTDKRKK